MTYIILPQDTTNISTLGGKAGALCSLQHLNLPIPAWFVLSPEAFYSSQSSSQIPSALLASWQFVPVEPIRSELEQALSQLCPQGERVAVRSSACDEDSVQHSFAGQLDSFLFVPPEDVADKVAAVWHSAWSDRILAYRCQNKLGTPRPPAVLIQRMVNAEVAGVAFGADPVIGRRGVCVIQAVYGLGTALVSGEVSADTYHVDRQGQIINSKITDKNVAHRYQLGGGIATVAVPAEHAKSPALTNEQIQSVAELVRQVGRHFGRPQDIEWAIEDGHLYLLQSRPITSLSQLSDPDGVLNLWDNSNIVESYGGVTTPLTFSFARRAYEEVYRQFCRMMGVPAATMRAHDDVFSRMLGLIQGRIYYNLLNWYRVLALLPGFTVNRRFMEQMMGVREELPEDILTQLGRATWRDRVQDSFRLLGTVTGLIGNYFLLPHRIKQFYQRLNRALSSTHLALEDLRPDELVAYYHDLERQLLTRWDAPLINDFFAMIFYGILRKLTEKWCGDTEATLQNNLISGEGGIISAEPAKRVQEMAQIASGEAELVHLLCNGCASAIAQGMEKVPLFKVKYQDYLEKFGDRCSGELKLESETLHDDPLPLLRAVGQLSLKNFSRTQNSDRLEAEQRVGQSLVSHPFRRLVFNWVLKNARVRVRDRENLRFERTRLFGRVRRIFVELGRQFYSLDLLNEPRDIFYLEVDEILGFVEGTTSCTDLKGLVALRSSEFERYKKAPVPVDRFETRGIVHHGNTFTPNHPIKVEGSNDQSDDWRQGIGCCSGVVRKQVRVISDPKQAELQPGTILVAECTDPGWIVLFPAAAGLLVERGSLLSHSAIVAREMGIPAVVSIPGLTSWLKDGDWVELDGRTGIVRRLKGAGGVGEAGGAGGAEVAERADFSEIRYAQCWEDADILLQALDIQPEHTCLSIGSAGDNTLAMLSRSPKQVIALDLSLAQLACLELRVAAYRELTYHELLVLIGNRQAERQDLYLRCRRHLSPDARLFWDTRPGTIAQGIGNAGKFERYFALFRRYFLPLVHNRDRIARLLQGGTPEQCEAFYKQEWNTWRWQMLFRIFFSRFVMGRIGRDPSFFKYVEGSVSDRILERTRYALTVLNPAENPYLQWILTGHHTTALPYALRPENFEAIRANLDRLSWHCTSVEDFLDTCDEGTIDRYNLSDMFEYMSPDNYHRLLERLVQKSRSGSRLAYWNMLTPRSRPEYLADQLQPLTELAHQLHHRDKAFFYSAFIVEEVF